MTEQLTDEALRARANWLRFLLGGPDDVAWTPERARWKEELSVIEELQARRAADPTETQRVWYGEMAEWYQGQAGISGSPEGRAHHARLAAHFGRLAQGE